MAGKNVTIGNVNISMSANAAALIRQVDKADKFFAKKIKRMIKTTTNFTKAMVKTTATLGKMTTLAGGLGSAAFTALAIKTFEAQREMQRMADVAGVSIRKFSAMSHITKSLGLETEYLADGMKDLNVRIVDAARGGGTMVDFFALMGEKAKDWVDLDPAEQLDKFIEVTGKLSANDSKFWADEVNDSMYRLSVTLKRSGKTMKEFQEDAKSLGAGTSAGLIGSVNGMYESFTRLKLILSEIVGTSFAVFSEALTVTFDKATKSLKDYIGTMDGSTIGEKIFNFSKDMVMNILEAVNTVIAVFDKAVKYLDIYNQQGLAGLALWKHELRKIEKEQSAIIKLMDNAALFTDDRTADGKLTERAEQARNYISFAQSALADLEVSYSKMAGTFTDENSNISNSINEMMTNISKLKYNPTDTGSGGGPKTNSTDPAKAMAALKYMKEMNLESKLATDSVLQQIALNKENLKVLIAQYDILIASKGGGADILADKQAAQDAIKTLDEDKAKRDAELLQDKFDKEKENADKITAIYQRSLEQRIAFDEKYGLQYQTMSDQQVLLEQGKLLALRDQEIISETEHLAALAQLTSDKTNAEVQMELTKLSDMATGLQAFMGKSKTLAKAAFAFEQGKALQTAVMDQGSAVAKVWASDMHWSQKIGQSVLAAANVGMAIQKIKSAGAGQFHDGGEIPYDGTYYMEGGEMVIPKDRVGEYIDAAGGSGGSGGTVIHANINMGANLVDEKILAAALSKQQSVIATLVRKEEKNRPSRNRSRNN
jgi:hypothetical protein